MFFSFDGVDGVGKSTQSALFCQWLGSQGHEVVACRDPGSTALGEQVRQILLASSEETPISRMSEMLLYMAARAQLVEEVIRPALNAGKVVVSDRYLLANVVYQAYAGGLDLQQVRTVGQIATGGLAPECVFLLDMSQEDANKRIDRELDRMENRGAEYRQRLRDGFLAEARLQPESIHVIDASRSVDEIQAEIREIAEGVLANGC